MAADCAVPVYSNQDNEFVKKIFHPMFSSYSNA